ncbi:unnamed protein product [Pleuronectes platessa]|uniref:Uncharacterized protein n=1 Tax=Pleuronectes platessa TaxID=8262 RepID=A0A9N7YKK6_PLEPL|nr:unnamed protein product [Pleuronectes platessa]
MSLEVKVKTQKRGEHTDSERPAIKTVPGEEERRMIGKQRLKRMQGVYEMRTPHHDVSGLLIVERSGRGGGAAPRAPWLSATTAEGKVSDMSDGRLSYQPVKGQSSCRHLQLPGSSERPGAEGARHGTEEISTFHQKGGSG